MKQIIRPTIAVAPRVPPGCREWPIRVADRRGASIKVKGIQLFFGADSNKVLFPQLAAGKLKLVEFPGRLELQQLNGGGVARVIGQVTNDAICRFYRDGQQLSDKNGPISGRNSVIPRHVSADVLFPILSRVKRLNNYSPPAHAFIRYKTRSYVMSSDPKNRYGLAAQEQRIAAVVLPDKNQLMLYERLPGEDSYIGSVPLNAPGRGPHNDVQIGDHLEEFRLKDIPVLLERTRARVEYRGIVFAFSRKPTNIHHRDLMEGRVFLRAGYQDRVEVIKKGSDGEEILGTIPVEKDRLIVSDDLTLPFDQGVRQYVLPVELAIDELGGREVTIKPKRTKTLADIRTANIKFSFPKTVDNVYKDKLQAGQIVCRVFRSRMEVGYREDGQFREIGRFAMAEARTLAKRSPWINLGTLIPELDRIEKRLEPGKKSSCRDIIYYATLPTEHHNYQDQQARRLILRSVNGRIEIFAERPEETEFIVTLPEKSFRRKYVNLIPWFRAVQIDENAKVELKNVLANRNHEDLKQLFTDDNGLVRLKRLAVFGRGYLTSPEAEGRVASKLLFALESGLAQLHRARDISDDLKKAFSREVFETMLLGVANPALEDVRTALTSLCRDALALRGGQR